MNSPKSLTAVVHVRFNYKEPEIKPTGRTREELIAKVVGQASELAPDIQNILVEFAEYLSHRRVGAGLPRQKNST